MEGRKHDREEESKMANMNKMERKKYRGKEGTNELKKRDERCKGGEQQQL